MESFGTWSGGKHEVSPTLSLNRGKKRMKERTQERKKHNLSSFWEMEKKSSIKEHEIVKNSLFPPYWNGAFIIVPFPGRTYFQAHSKLSVILCGWMKVKKQACFLFVTTDYACSAPMLCRNGWWLTKYSRNPHTEAHRQALIIQLFSCLFIYSHMQWHLCVCLVADLDLNGICCFWVSSIEWLTVCVCVVPSG